METLILKAIDLLLGIALAVILIIGGCTFANTYSKAMSYNDLSSIEKGILMTIDNSRYMDLKDSYDFITSLPLIGETL